MIQRFFIDYRLFFEWLFKQDGDRDIVEDYDYVTNMHIEFLRTQSYFNELSPKEIELT